MMRGLGYNHDPAAAAALTTEIIRNINVNLSDKPQ